MSLATRIGQIRDDGRRVPNSVSLAFFVFAFDGALLVMGLGHILGLGDMSQAGIQVFGTWYSLDTPLFPWVLGGLGALSLVAAWSAAQLRRFPFAMGVALFWVAFAIAIMFTGSGPGLLAERAVLIAALLRGRRAFAG